jgi:hypothetical protein
MVARMGAGFRRRSAARVGIPTVATPEHLQGPVDPRRADRGILRGRPWNYLDWVARRADAVSVMGVALAGAVAAVGA